MLHQVSNLSRTVYQLAVLGVLVPEAQQRKHQGTEGLNSAGLEEY